MINVHARASHMGNHRRWEGHPGEAGKDEKEIPRFQDFETEQKVSLTRGRGRGRGNPGQATVRGDGVYLF